MKIKKKAAVVMMMTALLCACFLSACGGAGDEGSAAGGAGKDGTALEGAAAKYAELLSQSDSTYYMKTNVKTQTSAEDVEEDVIEIAQAPGKQMVSSENDSYIQYYLSGKQYYYDTLEMVYYEIDSGGGSVSSTTLGAYAPIEGYEGTEEGNFNGTPAKYDTYRNETKYEGTKIVTITQYYVDEDGGLIGITSEQKNAVTGKTMSLLTMTILDFRTDLPDGVFDPPEGFKKAE